MASPGLLAHITVSKYQDALPLYRQETILRRIGVELPRATLANWMIQSRFLTKLKLPLLLADITGDLNVENDYSYGLKLFKRNLTTIATFCKSNHIELVLLSQPYTLEKYRSIREGAFVAFSEAIAEFRCWLVSNFVCYRPIHWPVGNHAWLSHSSRDPYISWRGV